jgi:GGDEF domain-containing protein
MGIAERIDSWADAAGQESDMTKGESAGQAVQDAQSAKSAANNRSMERRLSDIYIGNFCVPQRTLDISTKVSDASQMIRSDPTLPGFCIVEGNTLVGVTTRHQMTAKLSSQYGYSLYCNRGIDTIMCRSFLCVDFQTPIDIVVRVAMQRDPEKIYDFITVTRDGKYNGIVTVKDLLEKSIQIEVVRTNHFSSATNSSSDSASDFASDSPSDSANDSPSGSPFEKPHDANNRTSGVRSALDFDIDNFRPYNDVYGFEKGDIVMRSLSQILAANIPRNYFVGHVGEEDYISVASFENADAICRRVIDEFDRLLPTFYSKDDIIRGYIVSKNDLGIEEIYPLMSLTIANDTSANPQNVHEIADSTGKIKSIFK